MIRRVAPRPTRRWAIVVSHSGHVRRIITGAPPRVRAADLRVLLRTHGIAYGAHGDWVDHDLTPEERWTPQQRRAIAILDAPPIPWRAIAPERPAITIAIAMPAEEYAAACAAAEESAVSLNAFILEALHAARTRQARFAAHARREPRRA